MMSNGRIAVMYGRVWLCLLRGHCCFSSFGVFMTVVDALKKSFHKLMIAKNVNVRKKPKGKNRKLFEYNLTAKSFTLTLRPLSACSATMHKPL